MYGYNAEPPIASLLHSTFPDWLIQVHVHAKLILGDLCSNVPCIYGILVQRKLSLRHVAKMSYTETFSMIQRYQYCTHNYATCWCWCSKFQKPGYFNMPSVWRPFVPVTPASAGDLMCRMPPVHRSAGMIDTHCDMCVHGCAWLMCSMCIYMYMQYMYMYACTRHVRVCAEGGVYTVWRVIFGGSKFSDPDTRSHAERMLTRRLATPFDSANRVCAFWVGPRLGMARGINRGISCI